MPAKVSMTPARKIASTIGIVTAKVEWIPQASCAAEQEINVLKYMQLAIIALCIKSGFVSAQDLQPAFYAGFAAGYGSTTWAGLVPIASKQNSAISISTPIKVKEGGLVEGIFGGYEFSPHLAVEVSYLKYPWAEIFFGEGSLFAFEHTDKTSFRSKTEVFGFMGKLLLPVSQTCFRIYSSAGVAKVYRADVLLDESNVSPSFSVGVIFNMADHLMAQFSLNYTSGYGESELEPSRSYIPFLYSAVLGLAYRF